MVIKDDKEQGIIFATALSRLLGWLYFLAWTASFWPQTLLMYRRKSVVGISLDFISLNAFGFICYSIFNLAFLVSEKVQQQYRNSHHGQENLVRWNDAFFAIHAALIASWQVFMTRIYRRAPDQKVSIWCKIVLGILISIFFVTLTTCIIGGGESDSILLWIDFVNICSYIKLFITLIKYSVSMQYSLSRCLSRSDQFQFLFSSFQPQIFLNFSRKSTRGFAIEGITLDVTGGLLSLLQLFIDAQIINHDWSDVTGDPGKLGLSFISLFFDAILLVQHYVLYGNKAVSAEDEQEGGSLQETEPLLNG